MKIRILFALLSFILLSFTSSSYGEEAFKSKGIVNKVDVKAAKVNVDMDAVPSLKWPKMVMDFDVMDKQGLERLVSGQKVDFNFSEKPKGHWVIIKITPSK